MITQYFKLILRDLIKRKSFSLINIGGIALGFAVFILTMLYVYTEFSFDKYIPDVQNKYRIILGANGTKIAVLPYPFREILKPQLPEGSQICMVSSIGSQYLNHNNNNFTIKHTLFSGPQFLSMFGSSLLEGDTANVLNAPFQILLSEHTAQKIFGNLNPVDQTVRFGTNSFTITGVFHDLPNTSHESADAVISVSTFQKLDPGILTNWGNKSFDYYVKIPAKTNLSQLRSRIQTAYLNSDPYFKVPPVKDKAMLALEPITDIHLKSGDISFDKDKNKGDQKMVIAFIIIGILILLMAGFNYINLSTSYFQTKNTFSGIQKVLGAKSGYLSGYIFIQTSILILTGFGFSLILVELLLPYFNIITARQISFSLIYKPVLIVYIFSVIVTLIALSGLYPAIKFSRANPVFNLKKTSNANSSFGFSVRKLLVIAQFVISIALITSVLIMGKQIRLMSSQKLGFKDEHLIEMNFGMNKSKYESFNDELKAIPGVIAVSSASATPGSYIENENPFRLTRETKDKNRNGSSVVGILPDYFDVMKIKLLQGRSFSPATVNQNLAILSKTAVEKLGLTKPLGERVHLGMTKKDYTVIGVVDDVQYRTLREMPKPVIYIPDYSNYNKIVIRLGKGNYIEAIAKIKKAWHSILPDAPFQFDFFDSKLQSNYAYEIDIMRLLNLLMIISMLISSLGIFGLLMEMTVQRTKEIGIRKVNGARTFEVMAILNKDLMKWIIIAFIISCPIIWYVMHKWLENYAYKIHLSWWIFALAGLLALGVAMLTVSFQSWKAATRNPVEALRYE